MEMEVQGRLCADISLLVEDEGLADVLFQALDARVHAHRAVLACVTSQQLKAEQKLPLSIQ
jgi:hypothetical protein